MTLLHKLILTLVSFLGMFWIVTFLVSRSCQERFFEKSSVVCNSLDSLNLIPESVWFVTLALTVLLLPIFFAWRSSVFSAWTRLAIWAVPAIVIFTVWVTSQPSGGGVGVVGSNVFYVPLTILVYGVYFVTSLVIIFRAWRKNR